MQVLRWFQAVAGGATVTETAELAQVTQPALSRALGRLEREAGTPLFIHAGRRLQLTPAGRVFKHHLDQALDHYDRGVRAVTELVDPGRGVIPLAFLHTLGTWLVPPLISSFRIAHPKVGFQLRQDGEAAVVQALLDGAVDLVFTSDDPGSPQIGWRHLLTEPLRLAVPATHRLARRRRVRLAEVADEPFILLPGGYSLRAVTERLCREAGFTPRVAFEGEEAETLRALVAAGLGVALLPPPRTPPSVPPGTDAAAPYLYITDVDCSRVIGLAWLAERALPPASASFRQHVVESACTVAPPSYRP